MAILWTIIIVSASVMVIYQLVKPNKKIKI